MNCSGAEEIARQDRTRDSREGCDFAGFKERLRGIGVSMMERDYEQVDSRKSFDGLLWGIENCTKGPHK